PWGARSFPYTTLFRSSGAVEGLSQRARPVVCPGAGAGTEGGTGDGGPPDSGGGNWARAIDGTAVNSTATTRRHVNCKSATEFQRDRKSTRLNSSHSQI